MTLKLHINPGVEKAPDGIHRVLTAMFNGLPDYDIEIVDRPEDADVLNGHALAGGWLPGKPFVHSNHGLHWHRYSWPPEYYQINQHIINKIMAAQAVTVPTQWVANSLRRGALVNPVVIHHGVDVNHWRPDYESDGYVFWNKGRVDVALVAEDVSTLANGMAEQKFVSTFGPIDRPVPANMRVTGRIPQEEMHEAMGRAGVYLLTTQESFGISTLEALASGVPVAGWDWAGQHEIVIQGETGYLAPQGDFHALADCIRRCLDERDRLSENARQDAVERWQWKDKIEAYADLFHKVHREWTQPRPKVSVIVTSYNLENYLESCLDSVLLQTERDWECIVVDDHSEDGSYEMAQSFAEVDERFVPVRMPKNYGLSAARNYGFEHASGKYVIPLDGDDMLTPDALEKLSHALDIDHNIHITYGHLDLMSEDGSDRRRGGWPFEGFNWYQQLAHLNQLPYSAMMRREVLERSGGWRVRDWRAEDASLWCRVTSFGFRAAKITQDSTLIYRVRPDSKGSIERAEGHGDGDWTSWYPWRLGATTGQEGFEMLKKGVQPHPIIVPFGAQGESPHGAWPVHDHLDPIISVVIPVGPGHESFLIDALDSLQAQTFPFWEAVVVNDTGMPLEADYAPWANIVDSSGSRSIGAARNTGIKAANAPLVMFLDVDDILVPGAMQNMLEEFINQGGSKYIYTDWYSVSTDREVHHKKSKDWDQSRWRVSHPITVLIDRSWCKAVEFFDEDISGWEDWDFFIKLRVTGHCGARLAQPLLVYRTHSGQRRIESLDNAKPVLAELKQRYDEYYSGGKEMSGCCGGNGDVILQAKQAMGTIGRPSQGSIKEMSMSNSVRMEYIGLNKGAITINRPGLTRPYRGGNNPIDRYVDADPADVGMLEVTGKWRRARPLTGIDVAAAGVEKPQGALIPQAVVSEPDEPIEEQQLQRDELPDPDSLTVAELRNKAIGLGSVSLKQLITAEKAGQNRKTAIATLEMMLEDVERVN